MTNCAYHAEVQNAAFCTHCGRAQCEECTRSVRGNIYCENCLAEYIGGKGSNPENAPARKVEIVAGFNPGAAFALGLIPGVGAIYNAEYFKAAVHILVFGTLVSIANIPRSGPLFGMLATGFYFYMAFEAYYTAKKHKLRREGTELETPFDRFNQQLEALKNKELWGGAALIVIGVLVLLDNFDLIRLDRIVRLWPLILIAIGVWLLKRFQEKAV